MTSSGCTSAGQGRFARRTARRQAWPPGHRPPQAGSRAPLADGRARRDPTRQHAVRRSQAGAALVHEEKKQAGAARRALRTGNQGEAWPPGAEPPPGAEHVSWPPGDQWFTVAMPWTLTAVR